MTWQPTGTLFPSAEKVAIDKMSALLTEYGETGVHVDREVPTPRKPKMVIFTRDGGAPDVFDHPRLRVRVWANTVLAAQNLAAKVVALAPLMADGDPITRATVLSGPYEVDDKANQALFYALVELTVRGEALA